MNATPTVFVSREIRAVRSDELARLTASLPGHELLNFRFVEPVSINLAKSPLASQVDHVGDRASKSFSSLVNREHFAPSLLISIRFARVAHKVQSTQSQHGKRIARSML